jgi:hypothetical protein
MAFSLSTAAQGANLGFQSGGGVGSVLGGILGGFFGPKKKADTSVPVEPLDLAAEQKKSIQGNLANQADIQKLISSTNAFDQQQALSLMEKAMPGYGKLTGKLSETAQRQLANPYDIPSDVQSNLSRIAAERGVQRGTGGQFNDFSLLRDLGVNSLQYGQQNISSAQGITSMLAGIAPKVNPMSPISFYTTPGQQAQTTQQNNLFRQGAQQSNLAAQTSAQNYNTQNTWDALSSLAGNLGKIQKTPQSNPFEISGGNTGFNSGLSGYHMVNGKLVPAGQ